MLEHEDARWLGRDELFGISGSLSNLRNGISGDFIFDFLRISGFFLVSSEFIRIFAVQKQ